MLHQPANTGRPANRLFLDLFRYYLDQHHTNIKTALRRIQQQKTNNIPGPPHSSPRVESVRIVPLVAVFMYLVLMSCLFCIILMYNATHSSLNCLSVNP